MRPAARCSAAPTPSTARPPWTGSRPRSPSWPTYPDVLHLQRTTAFGHYDDGFVLALERRTDHLGGEAPAALSRQRVWRIRARHVLVAAGAHERPVVFTDNDRPGIMLAARRPHLPAPLRRQGRRAGGRVHHQRQRLRRRDRPARRRRTHQRHRRRPHRSPRAVEDRVRSAGHPGADRLGDHRHARRRAHHPRRGRLACRSRPAAAAVLRRVTGQRRLEPGRAPVQPGPRRAALRRVPRGLRARRAVARRLRRRLRQRRVQPGRMPARRRAGRCRGGRRTRLTPGIPIAGGDRGGRRVVAAPGVMAGARPAARRHPVRRRAA